MLRRCRYCQVPVAVGNLRGVFVVCGSCQCERFPTMETPTLARKSSAFQLQMTRAIRAGKFIPGRD